jgi:hypothetical protein
MEEDAETLAVGLGPVVGDGEGGGGGEEFAGFFPLLLAEGELAEDQGGDGVARGFEAGLLQ